MVPMLRLLMPVVVLASLLASMGPSSAQSWPTKPVRLLVPYAPGGASDTIARPWAEKLSQAFGQQFVIDNKGGAGGAIGTEAAAKAVPDGHTFLMGPTAPLLILPQLRKTPYDWKADFMSVGRVGDLVCGFVLHPSIPASTLPELRAYAQANPGKVFYGSAGLGTASHLRVEMLRLRTKTDIVHVPYRGSAEALADLLAGTVHMMNEIVVLPHVKAGKLKLLAINYPERHPDFPDVPTLTELGYPNSDVSIAYAVWAPKNTPASIIARFNAEIVKIAATPEMKQRLRDISVIAPLQTPDEMTASFERHFAEYTALIKEADVKLE
jgi:tripartite-type tricarboxylate transporter receptor subunit TctC